MLNISKRLYILWCTIFLNYCHQQLPSPGLRWHGGEVKKVFADSDIFASSQPGNLLFAELVWLYTKIGHLFRAQVPFLCFTKWERRENLLWRGGGRYAIDIALFFHTRRDSGMLQQLFTIFCQYLLTRQNGQNIIPILPGTYEHAAQMWLWEQRLNFLAVFYLVCKLKKI